MVTMSNSDFRDRNRPQGSRPSGVTPDDEVPVHGTRRSSLAMVPIAIFMCLVQTSFAAARYGSSDPQFLWFMFSTLVAIPSGLLLLARDRQVPVHGTRRSSLAMVPIAIFMCLVQTSFAAARYGSSDPQFLWFMFSTLVAIPSGLLLLARDRHPEAVFWGSCALVIAFPFDSMLALMAMTSLLARRSSRAVTVRAIAALVGLHLRSKAIAASAEAKADAAASQAHTLQADLNNQQLADAIAAEAHDTLAHLRSKAIAASAEAKADAAASQAHTLQADLNNQQLADAIAAEAHDTLAHSLSLLALNASALQAESDKLCTMTQSSEDAVRTHADSIAQQAQQIRRQAAGALALNASALQAESDKLCTMTQSSEDAVRTHADSIAQQAQQIRRQAAGALDEAHTIIDMLRHPEQAYVQLAAPSDDTALTRESLNALITDARQAGMRVDTWIDIQQLSELDDALGKIAAPSDDTALTRESLNALITDARQAGMRVDTWIDIQQLSELDDALGKIAYRTIQEGLTNARRHAPDAPVALQIDALPRVGVHIHISNPLTADERTRPDRAGSGLTGIAARIHSAGGTCAYGADERGVFHIDARLPWIRNGAEQQPNVAGLA